MQLKIATREDTASNRAKCQTFHPARFDPRKIRFQRVSSINHPEASSDHSKPRP